MAAPGDIKFHNDAPVTSDDVKSYHGAWAAVSHDSTDGVGIPDHHTFRFDFKVPFLDPAPKEFLIGATSRQFGLSAMRSRRSGRRSVQRCRYSAVWSLPRRRRRHSLCRSGTENRQGLRGLEQARKRPARGCALR